MFAFVALVVFSSDLKSLVKRLKKGKLFGQEVELREEIEELRLKAAEVKEQTAEAQAISDVQAADSTAPVQAEPDSVKIDTGESRITFESDIDRIVNNAAFEPVGALMELSRQIDRESRLALVKTGLLRDRRHVAVSQAIRELSPYGLISNVLNSVELFQRVRSAILHGRTLPSRLELMSAVESGGKILSALRSLPLSSYVVETVNIPLYSDPECHNQRQGIWGLGLKTIPPRGHRVAHQIFPTTKTDYSVAMEVGWEWNMNRVTDATWYIDPATGERREAWKSAAEFIGRDLNQI
jgi:hypothetical protein